MGENPETRLIFLDFSFIFLGIKLKSLLATQHTHIEYFICFFFSPHLFSKYLGDVNKPNARMPADVFVHRQNITGKKSLLAG